MHAHHRRDRVNRSPACTYSDIKEDLGSQQVFSGEQVMEGLASVQEKMVHLFLRGAIIAYQGTISPILGAHCRFYPSCSQYVLIAIERHGLLRGLFFGACRLLRCNGFFTGGYDPVPGEDGVDSASTLRARIGLLSKE